MEVWVDESDVDYAKVMDAVRRYALPDGIVGWELPAHAVHWLHRALARSEWPIDRTCDE